MIGNYIKAVKAALTTAKLMKTGQTTSYRTGDDGDIEAGRNVSFIVLAENNPFGNTNRFTDELGGQTYTKNIVIDWSTYDGSTVLGYRRTVFGGSATWNQAIDGALAVSIAPFTTGWRLPNRNEVQNIIFQSTINYSPFNITSGNTNMWISTSWTGNPTALAYAYVFSNATIALLAKTSTADYIPCRTFTVTGTTLS